MGRRWVTRTGRADWIRGLFASGLLFVVPMALYSQVPPQSYPPAGTTDQRKIIFAGDRSYPPFSVLDKRNRAAGYDVDLFRAAARHSGLEAEFRLGKWDEILADLEAGRVDVVPMFITDQRLRRFRFTQPIMQRFHLAFGRRGGNYIDDLAGLKGRRVAVQQAGMAWEELGEVPGVQLIPTQVEGDALRAVDRGLADYALVPMFIGYQAQRDLHLNNVVALSAPLLGRDYAYAVRPGNEALVERINAGLKTASTSGEQDQVYATYLQGLTPSGEDYRIGLVHGLYVAVPLLLALSIMVMWWRRAKKRVRDETASRAEAEALAQHLLLHDAVTGLPNRHALRNSLQPAVDAELPFALIVVELLDIDTVEAIAGTAIRDDLMRSLASRLEAAFGVGRVAKIQHGGFVVVDLESLTLDAVREAMKKLTRLIGARAEVSGVPFEQHTCAGAALFPQHGSSVDVLVRAATLALESARGVLRSGAIYDESLAPDPRKLTLLSDLREAIQHNKLGYAMQPKLDLRTNQICGAEMLVRWVHKEYGPLTPDSFVPLAEKTPVIGEMTVYLLREAAYHCRRLGSAHAGFKVAVNVSANDLADAGIVDDIIAACAELAGCVILEVTETSVMHDPDRVLKEVSRLREAGIGISLDDFGTGHSSLTYLRRLSPDEVKIDRSFVAGVFKSDADEFIVRSTIKLAHDLKAVVTAEGVEDGRTLEWLASAGCDLAQGYFIGRPAPPSALYEAVGAPIRACGDVTEARDDLESGKAERCFGPDRMEVR